MKLLRFFKIIVNILKFTSLNLLFYLTKLIPKNKKIWVFGSSAGEVFKDNSKYIYLFIKKNHSDLIKSYWISKNKKLIKELNDSGYQAHYYRSLKGRYYSLRAKLVIFSHGYNDVNLHLASGKNAYLLHGVPIKKTGYKNQNPNSFVYKIYNSKGWRKILYKLMYSHYFRNYDLILANSDEHRIILARDYDAKINEVHVEGYPRNDILTSQIEGMEIGADKELLSTMKKEKEKGKKILLYMPTFRDTRDEELNEIFPFEKLEKKLEALNCILIIKSHISAKIKEEKILGKSIIFSKTKTDPQPLLIYTDILITDYSSVYFDFLIVDKPIIFYAYDLDKYLKKDRQMYFEYEEVTPGNIAKNYTEFVEILEKIINNGTDGFENQRKKILSRFFKYADNKSSKRLFEYMLLNLAKIKNYNN